MHRMHKRGVENSPFSWLDKKPAAIGAFIVLTLLFASRGFSQTSASVKKLSTRLSQLRSEATKFELGVKAEAYLEDRNGRHTKPRFRLQRLISGKNYFLGFYRENYTKNEPIELIAKSDEFIGCVNERLLQYGNDIFEKSKFSYANVENGPNQLHMRSGFEASSLLYYLDEGLDLIELLERDDWTVSPTKTPVIVIAKSNQRSLSVTFDTQSMQPLKFIDRDFDNGQQAHIEFSNREDQQLVGIDLSCNLKLSIKRADGIANYTAEIVQAIPLPDNFPQTVNSWQDLYQHVNIRDGTRVKVAELPQIEFFWEKGRILKKVDRTALDDLTGHKFSYWGLASFAFVFAVTVAASLFYYRQRSR